MSPQTPAVAWQNGRIIPWAEATVHVRADGFMRGANVFEGIRGYAGADGGLQLFRLDAHLDRLFGTSMKVMRMVLEWGQAELGDAIVQLVRANDFHEDIHIRPTVYFGVGEAYSFDPKTMDVGCVITAVPYPTKPALTSGIKVRVASWRRIDDTSMPPRVKAGANYLNGRYVMMEARLDGYDSGIILNQRGKVAEGPAACVMIVRGGVVITPPTTADILESITRETLIQLLRSELGMTVIERDVDRTELYLADEIFFCGTAEEVQPIISVDHYVVGKGGVGPVVKALQSTYFDAARGRRPAYAQWLRPVY